MTVQIGKLSTYTDGLVIEFVSNTSLARPVTGADGDHGATQRTGLRVVFSPYNGAICIYYSTTPTPYTTACSTASGTAWRTGITVEALRRRLDIGLHFKSGKLSSVMI